MAGNESQSKPYEDCMTFAMIFNVRRKIRLLTVPSPHDKIFIRQPPSSSGPGRGPLKAKTGIRIPLGALLIESYRPSHTIEVQAAKQGFEFPWGHFDFIPSSLPHHRGAGGKTGIRIPLGALLIESHRHSHTIEVQAAKQRIHKWCF